MAQNVVVPPFDVAPETVVGSTPQSVFPFDFPFWETDDIIVYVDTDPLASSSFTVVGYFIQNGEPVEGGYGSGQVTLNTPVANCTVTIDRFVKDERRSQFSRAAPLGMPPLNADLNKATARDQDIARRLKAAQNGLSALESDLETIAAAAFTGAVDVSTREVAQFARIPSNIRAVRTSGYSSPGDLGEALYRRVSSEPAHPGKFQSADGAWWELSEAVATPQMFGLREGGALANNTAALQAALDYARGGEVFVPEGTYTVGTVIVPLGTRLRGAGPKVRLFGGSLSAGGTHFNSPTALIPQVWTDVSASGDAPIKVLFVAGGSGCSFENFSIGYTSSASFHDAAIFVPGVKRTEIRNVNTLGRWRYGVRLDATWGTTNTLLKSLHPEITADDGPIETKIENCWLQGLFGLGVIGTTRNPADYNSTTWVWSPAGVSDLSVTGCRLGADRDYIDISARINDGGGLEYSVRTISGSTGNRGWRGSFINCGWRSVSRYQIKLDYAHRLAFIGCEGETPTTSGLLGPAVLGLTPNTGDLSFVSDNTLMGVMYDGVEIASSLAATPGVLPSGAGFTYLGRDGRIVAPNLNLQTAANAPEIISGANNGQFDFHSLLGGVKALVARITTLSWRSNADDATDLGSPSFRFSRVFGRSFHPGTGIASRFWTAGSGSPEGVLSAAVGSLYVQTNGGAGTTLWVKESGTGPTGWVGK